VNDREEYRGFYMKRSFIARIVIWVGIAYYLSLTALFAQETITITTFFPSPDGVFNTLRLFPTVVPAGNCAENGTLAYNSNDDMVYLCTAGAWQPISGLTPIWTQRGNSLYTTDSTSNVGIGTASPTSKLDVTGNLVVSEGNGISLNGVTKTQWPGYGQDDTYLFQWGHYYQVQQRMCPAAHPILRGILIHSSENSRYEDIVNDLYCGN
jgi:hypothetical protein